MLGQKTSSISILKLLKDNQITNFTQTEFCQGNTTRWGLAWTFDPSIILRSVPSPTAGLLHKPVKSFTYNFQTSKSFMDCTSYLDKIFSDLRLNLERTSLSTLSDTQAFSGQSLSLLAKAYANHWTNIRRKRRLGESTNDVVDVEGGDGNRPGLSKDAISPILTFEICMLFDNENKTFTMKLIYLDGSAGVSGLYQLFQFLKNYVKPLEEVK